MTPSSITARARARQAVVLQAADRLAQQRQSERGQRPSRTRLAADAGMGYDQYARYVNGETVLRVDQIELFAELYEIDPDIFGRAILTGDVREIESLSPSAESWNMADDLRGYIPEDDIPGLVAEHAAKSIENQRAAAAGIKRNADRARDAATKRRPGGA